MNVTTRILTVAGLLGAIGLAGATYLHGQSLQVSAATVAADTAVEAAPFGAKVFRHGPKLDTIAEKLGITADELKKELDADKPFYQIAAEHGMTYVKLQEQHKAELKTKLDDMVKVGFMTQDEADKILENADDMHIPFFDGPHGFGMMKMLP